MSYVGYTYSAPTYPIGITFNANNLVNNVYANGIDGYNYADIQGVTLTIAFSNSLTPSNKLILDNLVLNNATIIQSYKSNIASNIYNAVAATITGNDLVNYVPNTVIDGYPLTINDTLLIKNQSNTVENGLYQVNSSGAPSRIGIELNTNAGNSIIYVNRGNINAGTSWICTNTLGQDVVGQTGLTFGLRSYPKVITASTGGPNGFQTTANNQIIFRIPYEGSVAVGPINSASIISQAVAASGTTYSVMLQTSGLLQIGITSTLTSGGTWSSNVIQITNPENIPVTSDILSLKYVRIGPLGNMRAQYAQITLK